MHDRNRLRIPVPGTSAAVVGHRAVPPPAWTPRYALEPAPTPAATNPGHNFGAISVFPPTPAQARPVVDQPGDRHEQEADRIADRVMNMPDPAPAVVAAPPRISAQTRMGEPHVNRRLAAPMAAGGLRQAPMVATAPVLNGLATGGGRMLDRSTRAYFEPRFARDFTDVRVHADRDAAARAAALGASAFTAGHRVFFGAGAYRPGTDAGRRLIAHELAHVVQQRGAPATDVGRVQCKIVPEDVAVEMIGREFTLSADHTVGGVTLKAGTVVTATSWSNASDTITATGAGIKGAAIIPKTLLRPVQATVAGVAPYSAGVAAQATAVESAEQKLAAWTAKESSYKTAKAVALYKAERARLEGLLNKKQQVLNRRLIQQTMFNRFDAIISKEVDAANSAHGFKGAAALDPNLLKSMLFQESQLGTAGEHLEQPPSHPVKTRFNLGQVIDSSGLALLTMLESEHPVVITLLLPTLRTDLAAAQTERATLQGKKTLNAAETARLATLDGLAAQNWEVFIWSYKSSGLTGAKFADVVALFFGATAPARNLDYGFWIHMAVLWLFEKHKAGMSWPETIKAYNGSGKRAKHYRDAVTRRAADAAAAAKAGQDFIPGGI